MDWSKKFSAIFQETEYNLAKVKERLDAASSSAGALSQSFHEPSANLSTADLDTNRFDASLQLNPATPKALIAPAWAGGSVLSPAPYPPSATAVDAPVLPSLDQSPGVVALLSDKIDAQNKTIEALTQAVNKLEEENQAHAQQVTQLREELAQVNNRIVERGVDLQTERKVEQWKHDVMSQLQLLQSQLQLNKESSRTAASHGDSQVTAVLRELHDLRTFIREECADVRNSVENLKSRLVLLEVDMNKTHSNSKGLLHRQDVLDRSFHDMLTTQTSASREINTVLGQTRDQARSDVIELRSSMRAIVDKLHTVENQLLKDSGTSSGAGRRKTRKKQKAKTSTLLGNGSPQYSDLELDLSADLSDVDSPDDGRKAGLGDYDDFNLDDISSGDVTPDDLGDLHTANLDDVRTRDLDDVKTRDLDDVKTRDLDDVKTADSFDLNLTVDDLQSGDDLELSDHDLSIEHLK